MHGDKIPQGIFIHIHAKGCLNETGLKLWLEEVWSKCPGCLLKKPAILACDHFRSHIMEGTKRMVKELNTQLAMIPGGLTSQMQPVDISIERPFQAFVCKEWSKCMKAPNHNLTPRAQMK
jgi:hypothetical protein